MDISLPSALKPGWSGPGCEGKYVYAHPLVLEGQCGTQAHFYLTVILVASYPLKPHSHSTSFRGVPLVVEVKVPRLSPLGVGFFSLSFYLGGGDLIIYQPRILWLIAIWL